MIIKEVRIKNFRSYYGDENVFEFSDGLTLILGDNGDGKTTFFEALGWLLNTTNENNVGSIDDVSEMKKSEMSIGEIDEVSVSMIFEHDGEKSVEKSFTFERSLSDKLVANKITYRGYETSASGREMVSGKALIDACYDAFIQRFSMFKGEAELNVFDGESALKELVDKFSGIREFDTLVDYSQKFAKNAVSAYNKEASADETISKSAKALSSQIKVQAERIVEKKKEISDKEDSLRLYDSRLSELENNQETTEKYNVFKDRKKNKEDKATTLMSQIGKVDYNHALLDDNWILCAFGDILAEFKKKCSNLSKEKRTQEKIFDRQKGEEIGKLKMLDEIQGALSNGATELPWYLPNQETMEEMLNDRICKVCGRPFSEHDEAYNFMVRKLQSYKDHIGKKARAERAEKEISERVLFKNDFIEELHALSISLSGNTESKISNIPQDIIGWIDLVDHRKKDLAKVKEEIQEIEDEIARLLIQAGNVSEASLEKDFNDIKGLFAQKNRAEVRLVELRNELFVLEKDAKKFQEDFNALNPQNSQAKVFKKVKDTMEAIANAFTEAKKENLRRFLADLEEKANDYLAELSANDFHGEIRLQKTANDSTQIKLFSSNGVEIKKPSGSQKTVMYISVLFAISDFTQEKRELDYPLIFDAATSSFGDMKEDDFYNVINKINKQCIIVTKDFLTKGRVRIDDINKLDCPVYRIQKAEGFDQNNLATIRTNVKKIKD